MGRHKKADKSAVDTNIDVRWSQPYTGVRWDERRKLWETFLPFKKDESVGFFKNEFEAAFYYDYFARKENLPTNFPYKPTPMVKPVALRKKKIPQSEYKGVRWTKTGWAAYYHKPGRKAPLYVGTYATEDHAAIAVDQAALKYEGRQPKHLNTNYGTAVLVKVKKLESRPLSPYGKFISTIRNGKYYQVSVRGKYVGMFKNLEDAKRARDEYCQQNFIRVNY